ncbi:MAG: InlB B-repeat-containing protein, partial [Wenzhouxiangella sp.]
MKALSRSILTTSLLAAVLCLASATSHAAIHYVDIDATGANNGSSWADAYTDLQDALAVAVSGDEIWVAEGLYRPTPGTDATISFVLKDGVGVYGGFASGETQRDERDWVANPTILDGDIDEDGTIAGNSQGLVRAIGAGADTVLDGFTIQYGAAVSAGGGLYIDGGGPTLSNLVFLGNQTTQEEAGSSGGGLFANNASLHLVGVRFIENTSGTGGGMRNVGGSLTLTDVVFEGNVADPQLAFADSGSGGLSNSDAPLVLNDVDFINNRGGFAAGLSDSSSGRSQQLVNVRFIGNDSAIGPAAVISADGAELRNALFQGNRRSSSAVGDGTALGITSTGNVTLTNLSFTGNLAGSSGDLDPGSAFVGDVSGAFVIDNALFWNNQNASGIGAPSASLASTGTTEPTIRSSLVQGCNPGGSRDVSCGIDGGGNLADTDPLLVDPPDPTAAPTEVGDSRLRPGSPAIDAGDNALYPGLESATDLDGNARLFGTAIDLGPFESPIASLDVSVVGSGNVKADPDQDAYELGASVALTATAASGWTFGAWSGAAIGETNPITVVLNSAVVSVTATFEKNPPIADAGPDQAVGLSIPTTLDASASFDEDPAAVLSYFWTQTAGETVTLDDSTAVQPSFVAPAAPDELQFALVVSNGSGLFAVYVTEVTVATAPYTIGGAVSGLKRPGLELSLNDGLSVL